MQESFMSCMTRGIKRGARLITLLSDEYMESEHCMAECEAILAHDPRNKRKRLIVFRVSECEPEGLLAPIPYKCLVPVIGDEAQLKERVLEWIGHVETAGIDNPEKRDEYLSAMTKTIALIRDRLPQMSGGRNNDQFTRGLSLVIEGIQKSIGDGRAIEVPHFCNLYEKLERFEKDAKSDVSEEFQTTLMLKTLRDDLSGFRDAVQGLYEDDVKSGLIPNNWSSPELKHYNRIETLLQQISDRRMLLEVGEDKFPAITRKRGLQLLIELEAELCLHDLDLGKLDNIRDRLEKLDQDIFLELKINSQLLLGMYASKLPPGSVFRDERDGPELVIIPSGSFMMGSAEGQGEAEEDPQHKVTINYPLAVGRFAVTVESYLQSVTDGDCRPPYWLEEGSEYNIHTGTDDYYKELGDALTSDGYPIVAVSWDDAQAFAAWLIKKTGHSYRLLSEAEWEYVCRAGTDSEYWWGDEISLEQANYGLHLGKTVPVDSYKPNSFGLYSVHGNVWEWCEDWWHESYTNAPADGSVWLKADGGDSSFRVLRGGSWDLKAHWLRARYRLRGPQGSRFSYVGFRVARVLAGVTKSSD